jgi:hypothetical protein
MKTNREPSVLNARLQTKVRPLLRYAAWQSAVYLIAGAIFYLIWHDPKQLANYTVMYWTGAVCIYALSLRERVALHKERLDVMQEMKNIEDIRDRYLAMLKEVMQTRSNLRATEQLLQKRIDPFENPPTTYN